MCVSILIYICLIPPTCPFQSDCIQGLSLLAKLFFIHANTYALNFSSAFWECFLIVICFGTLYVKLNVSKMRLCVCGLYTHWHLQVLMCWLQNLNLLPFLCLAPSLSNVSLINSELDSAYFIFFLISSCVSLTDQHNWNLSCVFPK